MRTYIPMYSQIYIYSCIHVCIPMIFMAGRNACVTMSVKQDIYVYIYTYIYKNIHTYIYAYIYAYVYKYIYIFIHTYMNTKYFHGRQECLRDNVCKTR